VTLPPTLADLAANPGELIASCQNCHHNAVLTVAVVLARYGPTTPFPKVKGRFHCSACGSRQVDVRPNWSKHSPGQITRHTDDDSTMGRKRVGARLPPASTFMGPIWPSETHPSWSWPNMPWSHRSHLLPFDDGGKLNRPYGK
jgi:hypothetical protein